MQLFSADAKIYIYIYIFFPQKVEKTTLKSCSEKLKSTFCPYCPELPKRPNQKNSCSKMWLIDQLYIELGLLSWYVMINLSNDSLLGVISCNLVNDF